MHTHHLPTNLIVLAVSHQPSWDSASDLSGWEAAIETKKKFASDEDAEDFGFSNPVDHVDSISYRKDGTATVRINPI